MKIDQPVSPVRKAESRAAQITVAPTTGTIEKKNVPKVKRPR